MRRRSRRIQADRRGREVSGLANIARGKFAGNFRGRERTYRSAASSAGVAERQGRGRAGAGADNESVGAADHERDLSIPSDSGYDEGGGSSGGCKGKALGGRGYGERDGY